MNDKPVRIQRKRTRGWKMPENTVYVGRPTPYGNPYVVVEDAYGYVVFWKSEGEYYQVTPDTNHYSSKWGAARAAVELYRTLYSAANVDELRGKNLACWCKPGEPCHADVLLELANKEK